MLVVADNLYAFVEALLLFYGQNSIDINWTDRHGNTVLHVACSEPMLDERIMSALLRFPGADTSATNLDGNTPLHLFCEKFSSPACTDHLEAFFSKGADINAQNNFGETLLHKVPSPLLFPSPHFSLSLTHLHRRA